MLHILEELLDTIKPKKTSSKLLLAAGITSSQQSVLIQAGNRLEDFWNHCTDTLDDSASSRQVDFFFEKGGKKYYFELKSNTNLDSEKAPATIEKVKKVAKELEADIFGILNPVRFDDYYESKLSQTIFGVQSMIDLLELPFTVEEYQDVLAKKLKEKLVGC